MEKKREIKFRAWDKGRKEMFHPYHIDTLVVLSVSRFPDGSGEVYGKNLVLMQFTGLLDKNGKEIYEGDLMTWEGVRRADGKPFTIEFSTELYGEQYGGGEDYFSGFSFPSQAKYGEVVGNIFENSELISK